MKCIDPGHSYEVDGYDGGALQTLRFLKRVGDAYPFNASAYGGTNCQEVLRVLIDRVKYLDRQQPCRENADILECLRKALLSFETRAHERHGKKLPGLTLASLEAVPACASCGHVCCEDHAKIKENSHAALPTER